jgi:NADH-quinone oxidoreductase subunit N
MGAVESLGWFWPEIILAGTVLALIVLDLFVSGGDDARRGEMAGTVAMVGAAGALVWTVGLPAVGIEGQLAAGAHPLFSGMVVLDGFAAFVKVLLGLSVVAVVSMSLGSREIRGRANEGEYYVVLMGSALGMFLMAAARNLLMAYLALEFVSLTSYVLTGFLKHNRRSSEAALKYLIYGGVASGAMIYGMSWIFGLTGSLDYGVIAAKLPALPAASHPALFVALVFMLVGFGYKVAAVPFHMWAPDVYTGAPLPVTTFLAVGSKAAGFALMVRFFHFGVSAAGGPTPLIAGSPVVLLLGLVSAITMTVGNLAALSQENIKRLLAYSSISHAGYALIGVVVFADAGVQAVLFYLAVYYVMNLGAFWVAMLVVNATGREDIAAFRGLAWRGGVVPAVALAIFLFSLAGLPPFAGFLAKLEVFKAGIDGGEWPLVLIGALNSVVSLYYYARVVRVMFLDEPTKDDLPMRFAWSDLGAVMVLSAATLVLFFQYGWLSGHTWAASRLYTG